MIAYHGSDSNFKKLRISDSLIRYDSTRNNEGAGIYFSTDVNIATSYGKYLYTLNINDRYVLDFRYIDVARNYVNNIFVEIYKATKVDVRFMLGAEQIQLLCNRIKWGGQCIYKTSHEIKMLLDSCERFYSLPNTTIARIFSMLNAYDKKHLRVYLFNNTIPNIGVLKTVDESVVQIIKKERL